MSRFQGLEMTMAASRRQEVPSSPKYWLGSVLGFNVCSEL